MMKNTINLINVNRASLLELLAQELPNRVGAPLSVKNIKEGIPIFAVVCKTGEKSINPAIFYFKERTPIPTFYQVHQGVKDYKKNGVRVIPVETFCKELNLP